MTEYELTTQDVRALRHADALCFDQLRDGTSHIRAILRAEHSSTGYEQVHTIPCTSRLEDYGRGTGDFTAYHQEMYPLVDAMCKTLLRHMRKGCSIGLIWKRDNNTENLRSVGFHRDELEVAIQPKHANWADTFLVAVSVGPDNTARMVKR